MKLGGVASDRKLPLLFIRENLNIILRKFFILFLGRILFGNGLLLFIFHMNFLAEISRLWLQVFRKDNRTMLSRKDLFKNTLRKAAHAWKRIIELRLTGTRKCTLPLLIHQIYSGNYA